VFRRFAAASTAALLSLPLFAGVAAALPVPVTRPLLLIAIPDLRWSDLSHMPVLTSFAGYAAVGNLSVRSEGATTRCGDGLLEISAGTRVRNGVTECSLDAVALARQRRLDRHNRYGARLGTLGDLLQGQSMAIGPAASMLLTTSSGAAPLTAPDLDAAFAALPNGFVATVDDGLYGASDRVAAAKAVDGQIKQQFLHVPLNVDVIIAGISDGRTGGPHLHPVFIAAQGFPHRELISPTTGRAPYVQLFDLTATVLSMRAIHGLPSSVVGRPVHTTLRAVRELSSYADADRHARAALSVGHPTFTAVCLVLLVALLLAGFGRRAAGWVARPLALFAPFVWLVQLLPWWRWGTGGYAALLIGAAVISAALATLLHRWSSRALLLVGASFTVLTLLADQLAGAPLQQSAPWGDNPLVAGRFHGMGNIDFGVTMAAVLLGVAVLASSPVRNRRLLVGLSAAIAVAAVVVDGLPRLGDDIGGVVTLVPALAVLAILAAGVALTRARVATVVLAAVLVALGAMLLDYARPADRQTHAGRFVGQVLHGGAWQVVHRKLDAVLASFDNPAVTALVVVAAIAAALAWRRQPQVRPAIGAVATLAVVGSALNDSGVFVAAAAAISVAPPLLVTAGALSGRAILDDREHRGGRGRRTVADGARSGRPRRRSAAPSAGSSHGAAVRGYPRRRRPRS
jgi:hypothetical protein